MQAEQKAREESERLRQQEREQIAEKRRRDLVITLHPDHPFHSVAYIMEFACLSLTSLLDHDIFNPDT